MNNKICTAIRSKKLLRFRYNEGNRTVESYCYGETKNGKELLRAYQITGYSESGERIDWKLFSVKKLKNIRVLEENFTGRRPDYNPNDPVIEKVYCRV